MSAATATPRSGLDARPAREQGERLDRQFELALLRGEQVRLSLVVGFFAVLSAVLTVRLLIAIEGGDRTFPTVRMIGLRLAVSLIVLGLEWLMWRHVAHRIAAEETIRPVYWYVLTIFELSALAAVPYLHESLGTAAPIVLALEIPVVILLLFTGLSAMRLRFAMSAFTGFLAGVVYLVIAYGAGITPEQQTASILPASVPASWALREGHFWVAGLIAGSGLIAGYVAQQVRRQTLHVLGALTERQRLEREVARVGDEERHRIGRDLHDGLGSQLTGLALLCRGLVRRVSKGQSIQEDEIERVAQVVEESVEQTRRLAHDLSPLDLAEQDLPGVLDKLAARTKATTTIACRLTVRGPVRTCIAHLDADAVIHLYRIAQEAIHNAIRHARPTLIALTLAAQNDRLVLTIDDDGCGLSDLPEAEARRSNGLGLRTMRYRAGLIGGTLTIESDAGTGTRVRCEVPIGRGKR